MGNIVYVCDGKRCVHCNADYCQHTSDLAHATHYNAEPNAKTLAKRFERLGDYWFEKKKNKRTTGR